MRRPFRRCRASRRLIPDWLALVGDTADGIPGLPGFGEKGAAAVLRAFGPLESIPTDAARWPKDLRSRNGWPRCGPHAEPTPCCTGLWPRFEPTPR